MQVRIQSSPAGPVRQIWVSGPVRSGNSYAQSGRALIAGGHYSSMLLMSYSLRSFFDQIGIWHFFDALRIGFDFQQDFALFDLFRIILNTKVLKCLNQCFARLRSQKSVSSKTAVDSASRFCEFETLFPTPKLCKTLI